MKSLLPFVLILACLPPTTASAQDSNLPLNRIDPTEPSSEQLAAEKKREEQQAIEQKWAEDQTAKREDETEQQHIERLIELLVFLDDEAKQTPETQQLLKSDGAAQESSELRKRFYRCQMAFTLLSNYKATAFPAMVSHLDDKRGSIHFRNHFKGSSVGDACYWNIYLQLQDRPEGYPKVGLMRLGRDGKEHEKPYWAGITPFDELGAKNWLEANKHLSYPQMQIKCLTWLLEKEKAIGAPDADGYFINILPLEIQILKRRIECGEKIEAELANLELRQKEKRANEIPPELLPAKE
jgi:hypothetical protein